MRFLFRFLIFICLILALKGLVHTEPVSYISLPEREAIISRVEWEVQRIQKVAQDLPASIEIVLRRLFGNSQPITEAKSV